MPDLGRHSAGDATALNARPKTVAQAVHAEVKQGLPQPSAGKKEYKDEAGNVTEVYQWFGYKLHLLVDVKHEAALADHMADAKAGDNERVEALVERAQANLPAGTVSDPSVPQRISYVGYDKQQRTVKYRGPARHESFDCPRAARLSFQLGRRANDEDLAGSLPPSIARTPAASARPPAL